MVHIRQAARGDLETLFELDQACFRQGIAYSKAELRYFLFRMQSISLVAMDENGIAGFAIAEISSENKCSMGHVVTIDVAPAQRRRGVGRLLMEELLEHCRKAGAVFMRLEVAVDNKAAIGFYKVQGFVETGRLRGFYTKNLDALQMEKELRERPAGEAIR